MKVFRARWWCNCKLQSKYGGEGILYCPGKQKELQRKTVVLNEVSQIKKHQSMVQL